MFLLTKGIVEKGEEFQLFVKECIHRFNKGDWGEVCDKTKEENNRTYRDGYAFATYDYNGEKVCIELENEVATIMLSGEM